jgi:hypothetical protein
MSSYMFPCRVDGYKKDQLFLQIRYHDIFLVIHLFILNVRADSGGSFLAVTCHLAFPQ